MKTIYIVDAVRTPIGEFGKSLKEISATQLGSHCVAALLKRNKLNPKTVDELIFGNVVAAGTGLSPGRVVAIKGGLPNTISAFTVNKACGSGMKAVVLASHMISAEEADLVIAGGMESMSQAPYLLPRSEFGEEIKAENLLDANQKDGLTSAFKHWHMGNAAEYIAKKYKITRKAQDQYALRSHQLAVAAAQKGKFKKELIPLKQLKQDERPRPNTNLKKLAALSPPFQKKGTVTAGNAPGLNDGASALLLASEKAVKKYKLKPKAKILGSAVSGLKPELVFITPVEATKKVLKKLKLKLSDIDYIECNEAFAAEMLATEKLIKWDRKKVNIYGGAIALGHPVGASGARILTTLTSILHQEKGHLGLATICMGGGNGLAMVIEKV